MKTVEKIANIFGVSRNSILAGLPVEMLEQEGQEDRRVVDLTDLDIRLTYMGQQVPREYIDIIEKLMRCDIAERDAPAFITLLTQFMQIPRLMCPMKRSRADVHPH